MVERSEYLAKLNEWKHEKVIKVVTGIRRCGKSTLLSQFQEQLKKEGVADRQIISVNFEELENEYLTDYRVLHQYVTDRLCKNEYTYIFLDEVQVVKDFQKAVDSLYVKDMVDLYITGSNAYLLSGELATLLSGRYIEINLLPLSFAEFYGLNRDLSKEDAFSAFLSRGGFPYLAESASKSKDDTYLEGIYNTVIVKDIEERDRRKNEDKNKRKITDTLLLKTISKYLASVIGNPVSVKSIADYLSSNGRKTSPHTVDDYIEALTEAYLFYPAERFDISGKNILKRNGKMYIVDLGLKRLLVPKTGGDIGYSIENLVFFELLRRGYSVNVGKSGTAEVDFVATKNDITEYYQVTASMLEESTFAREMKSLKSIKDNYPKTVLTLDPYTKGNYEGILVENLIDWLLRKG